MHYMVNNELEHSKNLKEVSPELSLITNLQNVKYSLLADYADEKIFSDFLIDLDITDELIQEHLAGKKTAKNSPKYLPRDPAAFRKHIARIPVQTDAFSQFYLKEALR